MSVTQMSLVWGLDLPPNKRLVLLAYADHADDEGENVYPSLPKMAQKTGYGRDQVRRITRQLEQDELMEKVEEGVGRGNTHRYRLTLGKGSKLPPFKPRRDKDEKVASEPEKVASDTGKGCTAVQPEPSIEPSESSEDAREENGTGKLAYLDESTRRTVEALLGIKGWDRSEARTVELVADVRRTYPSVDCLATATSLAFKVRTGAVGPYRKPSKTFANWVASDATKTAQSVDPPRRRKHTL